MNEDNEINLRAVLFIGLFVGAILYFALPLLFHTPDNEYKDFNGKNIPVPDGFIKADNGTPIPLTIPTPEIITEIVYVTPTPDNGYYYASENQNGIRKMQRYFVFHRNDVLGLKDLDFRVTVYGFKILDVANFYNVFDAKYYPISPNSPNSKFLFIFVQMYSDDITGDDVRNYIPPDYHYQVEYEGINYQPIAWDKDIRIYELENTFTFNDDHRIEYYGQFVKQDLATGKYNSEPLVYSLGGRSNAVDGYIVYEIPKDAEPENLTVNGDFFAYGFSQWLLKV